MGQSKLRPAARRSGWVWWLAVSVMAGPLARADIDLDVRGVDEQQRSNVLAYLSFARYRKGGGELTADTVERLHNRVEREVRQALRPLGFYEPKVDSTVTDQGHNSWRVIVDITPGPPVLLQHIDVRVDGPG